MVFLALGSGAALEACSQSDDASGADVLPQGSTNSAGSSGSSGAMNPQPISDSSGAPPTAYQGNPLCHIDPSPACTPDDDAFYVSRPGCAVVTPMDDASVASGTVQACRIAPNTKSDAGGYEAQCGTGDASGTDGAKCTQSSDCAAGFDCVVGEKGVKSCRHYCCSGSCDSYSASGNATFCDVQSLADLNILAPVCMPVKHCETLLAKGECGADETCTLVNDNGDTGCVTIGDKAAGDSCDQAHCAADLACVGQPGARKCLQLCHVGGTECPSTQTCMTNAAFKDSTYGVCTNAD